MKKTKVFLKVRLRRKDLVMEALVTGTGIWTAPDQMILDALVSGDFANWKDGTKADWFQVDEYEHCLINLRD